MAAQIRMVLDSKISEVYGYEDSKIQRKMRYFAWLRKSDELGLCFPSKIEDKGEQV